MSELNITQPLVGIGVLILKNSKVLLCKRKNAHGEGEYAFPGGHLEHNESFEDCALREIKEECGIEVSKPKFQLISNINEWLPRHYIHIGFVAEWEKGEPKLLEPEKHESWDWYELDKLPEPLFYATKLQLDALHTHEVYFDLKK